MNDYIRILPDGTICPSTYLIRAEHRSDASIKTASLKTLRFQQFENTEIPFECLGCTHETTCRGGAYDRRILWYGSLSERDPYCPTKNGRELPKELFKISKEERVSIHDGYLPTLFFRK